MDFESKGQDGAVDVCCVQNRKVRVACGSRHRLLRGPLQGLLDYKSSVLNSQWFSPAFHFHVVLHAGKS